MCSICLEINLETVFYNVNWIFRSQKYFWFQHRFWGSSVDLGRKFPDGEGILDRFQGPRRLKSFWKSYVLYKNTVFSYFTPFVKRLRIWKPFFIEFVAKKCSELRISRNFRLIFGEKWTISHPCVADSRSLIVTGSPHIIAHITHSTH